MGLLYWKEKNIQADLTSMIQFCIFKGLVYVVDGDNREMVRRYFKEMTKFHQVPVLICILQQEGSGGVEVEELLELKTMKRNYLIQRCSFETGEGVIPGLTWLLSQINS